MTSLAGSKRIRSEEESKLNESIPAAKRAKLDHVDSALKPLREKAVELGKLAFAERMVQFEKECKSLSD